ncbi:MAG: ABC transporter substrate-binding protein [Candidatus Woesearchaeota archaeon]
MKKDITFMLILIGALLISGCKPSQTGTEEKILTIGIARWNSESNYGDNLDGFKDSLAEQGFVEGKNIKFITKNPESDLRTQRQIIESFVEARVDLIYSQTTPGTLVAKNVTQTIPIVFSIVTYPVESGVIEALESSGNNLVGTRNFLNVQRQYDQFEKVYASTKTLAFVHRKDEPNSVNQYNQMKELLTSKGIELVDIAAVDLNDLRTQLEDSIENVDSLFLACDTLINVGGQEVVIEISKEHKKPNFACLEISVVKGALMGDVADFYVIGKISGRQAALILGGAMPSSLLTESPAEDYLMINAKTAAEIGITIPQYVLDDAEEIIQ